MTTATAPVSGQEPAGPSTGVKGWVRLQLALCATALAVVLVRTLQLIRLDGQPNTVVIWRLVLASQAAYWIAWSLWAGALIPLVRRLVERPPSRFRSIASLIALAVLPPFFVPILYAPVHWLTFQRGSTIASAYGHMANHDILTNILLSATIVGVVYGYLGLQHARRLEVRASQLSEQLIRAQLDTLRAQLNPHFLFNALNSVAVLARRGRTHDVEQMITRLSDLLRHSLESSRAQLVTLGVETQAVRRYLEIEKVRFAERLDVVIDVPEELQDRVVPSFLLQPLLENAVRHGFRDAASVLHVELVARADARGLSLTITDDGAGIDERQRVADGLGIGNTRSRLAGLYGASASISLMPGERGRGTVVTVVIPHDASGAQARAAS